MIDLIEKKRIGLEALCRRHHVKTLEVFGSATDGSFDAARSDLDFLVRFESSDPLRHYEDYFGVLEGLQRLFKKPIDLIEADAMRNPYFIRSVQKSRRLLYAA